MFKSLLTRLLSGKASVSDIPEKEQLEGLSLRAALDSHEAWKDRLKKALDGEGEYQMLDTATVSQDCHCELGKWIYGPGKKKFGKLPEYEEARKAHAEFHLAAAEVLIEHNSGHTELARELLNTRFRQASNRNQLALVRLFSRASH